MHNNFDNYNNFGNHNSTGNSYAQGGSVFLMGGGNKGGKGKGVAAAVTVLVTITVGGWSVLPDDADGQSPGGGPLSQSASASPIKVVPAGGSGANTAKPTADLEKSSQIVLNDFYVGFQRYWLDDTAFDLAHFHFPLNWYGDRYGSAEEFAAPKKAYVARAKAGHWKKGCKFFAAEVQAAELSGDGKDIIVEARVTEEPGSNCDSSKTSVDVEYVLTPSTAATYGYKIKSVQEF